MKVENQIITHNLKEHILPSKKEMCLSDFKLSSIAGNGSYAKVYCARYLKDPNTPLRAIKVMKIEEMENVNKLYQAYLEIDILSSLSNPNIVNIEGAFKDNQKIYIVLQYLSNGDFSDFLKLNYPLPDETIRFYAGEIVYVLDYLRKNKIIHRDIKPENMMLDDSFHLKLIDFATAKKEGMFYNRNTMLFEKIKEEDIILKNETNANIDDDDYERDEDDECEDKLEMFRNKRGNTFVGTAEYISPEVLKDQPAGYSSDTWALGIIIYLMYVGKTPFKAGSNYFIFKNISEHNIYFPQNIPEDAKDIITKLLILDPKKRLGGGKDGSENDFKHLKAHHFFKGIEFDNLFKKEVPNCKTFTNKIPQKSLNRLSWINTRNEQIGQIEVSEMKKATIKKGTLQKKSSWFYYETRIVTLDATPRISYLDPETDFVKGLIYLSKDCKAEHVNKSYFDIYTPKRVFHFKVSL